MMARKTTTKRLGEILLDSNIITEDDLCQALQRQKKNGELIGRNLVELGCIDEDEITQCLAEQYSMPCISLDRFNIDKEVFGIIGEDLTEKYSMIAIDLIGDILTVGIVDVPDDKAIRHIQEHTGFRVQVMMISRGDFDQHRSKAREFLLANGGKAAKLKTGKYVKTPAYEGKERRRFPRFNKELKIKYEFRKEYNINSSVNISRCGILIKSKAPVPVNSHIVIKIELPTSYEDVIAISKVVRVERSEEEDVYMIGLNFDSMDAADSRHLANFVKSLKK